MIPFLIKSIIIIMIMATSADAFPTQELTYADKVVKCMEQDKDSVNIFESMLLRIQGITKTEDRTHNLLTVVFAGAPLDNVFIAESMEHLTLIANKCRKSE